MRGKLEMDRSAEAMIVGIRERGKGEVEVEVEPLPLSNGIKVDPSASLLPSSSFGSGSTIFRTLETISPNSSASIPTCPPGRDIDPTKARQAGNRQVERSCLMRS